MRSFLVPLGLLATLPLCAQDVGHWSVDVHSTSGTISGHYIGTQSGEPFLVDLKNDLALASTGNKIGYGLEYQGHRFGLELSMDTQNFAGSNQITRDIVIDGQDFTAGGVVSSSVKTTTTVLNWTIRALTFEQGWIGIDLGVRDVKMDIYAQGAVSSASTNLGGNTVVVNGNGIPNSSGNVSYSGNIPLPMIGLAAGFNLFEHTLVGRAYYHTLQYSGASYNVAGADLRYFPINWVGVRAFANSAKLSIPKGSIKSDVDIALDQTASGFGVVFRF